MPNSLDVRKTYPFLEPVNALDGMNSALPMLSPLFPSLLDLLEGMPMTLSSTSTTLPLVFDAIVTYPPTYQVDIIFCGDSQIITMVLT